MLECCFLNVFSCLYDAEEEWMLTGCRAASCLNGGVCVDRTATCLCPAGYEGPQCQVRVTSHADDVTDPCASHRCLHGGKCLMIHADNGRRSVATCRCSGDWTGKHCQVRHSDVIRQVSGRNEFSMNYEG